MLCRALPDMDVQQSVTPPYPEVSIHNEGDSSDDVIKTSSGIMCCRTEPVYEGTVSSRAEQLHSGLLRVLNGEKSGVKMEKCKETNSVQ